MRAAWGTTKVENLNKLVQAALPNRCGKEFGHEILVQAHFHTNVQAGILHLESHFKTSIETVLMLLGPACLHF